MFNFTQPIPLALYIHIPWCISKCWYCDFNSHAFRQEIPETFYVERLMADLDRDLKQLEGRNLISIFIGGGTPSLFSPQSIEKILAHVHKRIPYSPHIEITLEANPGTVELSRFQGFQQAGINRLSLGIQSFQDDKLKALGRVHDSQMAYKAIEIAQNVGFNTFNIDLMYGLPQQTSEDALSDIKTALSVSPPHLSWYHLTIEPNTLFHHQPPALPNDEAIWEIQEQGQALLKNHGFENYEVSAYCQPNHRCTHNMNYWEFGDYLGIGAGAHSKITLLEQQTAKRFWKVKHPKSYLAATENMNGGEDFINKEAMPFEFMLNALRLNQPISVALFEERTGLPVSTIQKPLMLAKEKGLLTYDAHTIETTPLGMRFLNDLMAGFLV